MLPSTDVQKQSLQNLRDYVRHLTPDKANIIKRFYSNTCLKTNFIFLIIGMRSELSAKFHLGDAKNYDKLLANFSTHLDFRIRKISSISLEQAQYADVIFACNQVSALALKRWSSSQAQEMTLFKAESLPNLIRMLEASDKSEDITETFEALISAFNSENFSETARLLEKLQELLPSPI